MKIQQIRNATVKIDYAGTVFLMDPWLQDRGTGFSARALKPEMKGLKTPLCDLPFSPEEILKDVDYCLATHFHPDHFTADYLPKEIKIIAQNQKDLEKIQALGFVNVICFTESSLSIGNCTIRKVPAVHGDNAYTAEHMGEGSGYVFKAEEEKTLYVCGDTVYCEQVHDTILAYHPEVIIVNSCEARLEYGRLIMDLEDIASVCKDAPGAAVIASHMDNVNHAMITREDVRQFIVEKSLKQVLVPEDGETLVF